jgi:DNA-binding transcriptional LysR family regulator
MLMSQNLQAFLAVVRAGTVIGASGELGLTQTGVTQRIKAIERDVGATLFTRNRKGMTLTQEGEAVLQYCLQAEELEGRVLSAVSSGGTQATVNITIAGPTSLMAARIVRQTRDLHRKWPQLRLNYRIDDDEQRLALLKTGKAQLVVLRPQDVVAEVDSKLLQPDRYLLVGHPNWKGRRLQDILMTEKIIDFHADDPTTTNYLKAFGLWKQACGIRIYANENQALTELFCGGVGYGTLTKEIAEPFLNSGRLIVLNGGQTMQDAVALAWYPRREMPAYFHDIVTAIK